MRSTRTPPRGLERTLALVLAGFIAVDLLLILPALASEVRLDHLHPSLPIVNLRPLAAGRARIADGLREEFSAPVRALACELQQAGAKVFNAVYYPAATTSGDTSGPTQAPTPPDDQSNNEACTAAVPSATQTLGSDTDPDDPFEPTLPQPTLNPSPTSTQLPSYTPTSTQVLTQHPTMTPSQVAVLTATLVHTAVQTASPTPAWESSPLPSVEPSRTPTVEPSSTATSMPLSPTPLPATGFYYVAPDGDDSGPGTLNQPWRTIQKAADTMIAGDSVYVRSGVYSGVNLRRSGAPGQYITFQAYPGDQPVLEGGIWAGFVDRYSDNDPLEYFVIDGFQIMNFAYGINLTRSRNFILRNNVILNSIEMGMVIDGAEDAEIVGNTASNTRDDGGIWVFRSSNIDIHHNIAYSNAGNGIGLSDRAQSNLVHNNVAFDNSCGWDQQYAGIAIEIFSEGNKVFNNLIYRNCNGGYVTNSPNNEIYHNTFFANTTRNIYLIDWMGSVPENNVFKNNIILLTETNHYAISLQTYNLLYDGLSNVFDNNLYYNTSGLDDATMIEYAIENTVYTFAQWQAVGMEAEGILSDPKLVDPVNWDFRLQAGSPAIDDGASVGVPNDIDGNPRPRGGGYDIGAYEY